MNEVVYIVVMASGDYSLSTEQETYASVSLKKAEKHFDYLGNKIVEASDVVFEDICNNSFPIHLPDSFVAPEYFHRVVNVALMDNDKVELSIYKLPLETPMSDGKQLVKSKRISLEKYCTDIMWGADYDDYLDDHLPAVPYEDVEADILGDRS